MEHGVGGATEGHVEHHAVVDSRGSEDVERRDALFDQVHHLHARLLGEADALGIHGRHGAVAGKRQAEGLGQAADRVGGEHTRATAARGTGGILEPRALLLGHGARCNLAHGVEKRVQIRLLSALIMPGEHGPAGDEHGGDIQTRRGDEHAGDDLVATGDEDHRIELVALDSALDGICDDLARDQTVVHALMVHGDAVAHADGVDLQRRTAGHANARLHGVGNLLEVEVPWDNFVLRGDHGDERPLKLLVGKAICLEQAPVRRTSQPLLHGIASEFHTPSLPFTSARGQTVGEIQEMRGHGMGSAIAAAISARSLGRLPVGALACYPTLLDARNGGAGAAY